MKFFKTIAVLAALLLVSTIGFAQQKKTVSKVAKPKVQSTKNSTIKVESNAQLQKTEKPIIHAVANNEAKALVGRVISKELLTLYTNADKNYMNNVVLEGEQYVDYNNIYVMELLRKKAKINDDYNYEAYKAKQKEYKPKDKDLTPEQAKLKLLEEEAKEQERLSKPAQIAMPE